MIYFRYIESNDSCREIVIETLKFLWDLEVIDQKTEAMETPFLATPRIPNSILFAIGGWSVGSPTGLIEAYDTKADRWIQVSKYFDELIFVYSELIHLCRYDRSVI